MMELRLYYTAEDGGIFYDWPTSYEPRLEMLDELSLGSPYIKYPMENGMEQIHCFAWKDADGEIVHRWDSINGWTEGGPE